MRPVLVAVMVAGTVLAVLLILAAAVLDLGGPRDEVRS